MSGFEGKNITIILEVVAGRQESGLRGPDVTFTWRLLSACCVLGPFLNALFPWTHLVLWGGETEARRGDWTRPRPHSQKRVMLAFALRHSGAGEGPGPIGCRKTLGYVLDMLKTWESINRIRYPFPKLYKESVRLSCFHFMYYLMLWWETLGWKKHKLESRLPGEISVTSDMQMTPNLMAKNEEELKSLLMKVKEESEKVGLKLNEN